MKSLIVILLAVFVVLCSAQNSTQTPEQQETLQQINNDVNTLNYALTLEHLEATFYTDGLARFNDSDFTAAGYPAGTRDYINLIRAHEVTHVNTLVTVINSLGAQAVRRCVYNFTDAYSSVTNFISTARLLEATGTSAYDGAANTLNDATLLQAAATIATVEARHTAYLNELNNMNPYPQDRDTALSPRQVLAAAAGFFISCPDTFDLPKFAYEYVPLSYNQTYNNESGQPTTMAQMANDNKVLNYALTLELFGGAFYSQASARFNQTDFTNAGYGPVYTMFQISFNKNKPTYNSYKLLWLPEMPLLLNHAHTTSPMVPSTLSKTS